MYSRAAVVNQIESWIGKNEMDGSYREIIDIYNSFKGPFPRNVKMQYGWAWCAATWSAIAIKLGYTEIMPIEISCGYLVEAAKQMGIWVEDDAYIPKPGDAVLYDWDASGSGDCIGWPDHIGTVVAVNDSAASIVVAEGNYNGYVQKRVIPFDYIYVRGFITPKYDADTLVSDVVVSERKKGLDEIATEVIAGLWGNWPERELRLTEAGYNYYEVQEFVENKLGNKQMWIFSGNDNDVNQPTAQKITAYCAAQLFNGDLSGEYVATAVLNMRQGPGTNRDQMLLLPEGTHVMNYGYYSKDTSNAKWLYVQAAINRTLYTGFCHSDYLKKIK